MRRTVPLAITFIVGVVLIVSKFIPHKPFGTLGEEFSIYFDIIAVFAFILGGGNLVRLHGDKIYRRRAGWGYSVICLLGFFFTLIIGLLKVGTVYECATIQFELEDDADEILINIYNSSDELVYKTSLGHHAKGVVSFVWQLPESEYRRVQPGRYRVEVEAHKVRYVKKEVSETFYFQGKKVTETKKKKVREAEPVGVKLLTGTIAFSEGKRKTVIGFPGNWKGDVTSQETWFYAIYEYSFKPLAATMFALLAFYVASASYRAFRAKNIEATVLLVAAFVILLGRTFIGKAVSFWVPIDQPGPDIPTFAEWIMDYPNRAGQRAIMIGIALGIVSTSLKLILGIERAYLGVEEE